jgi:menaquinone-dependent protoporphyrinogen oxidase
MKRVLVTYATMAGSTAEVANAIGEELRKSDLEVDVKPIAEVEALDGYAGVVVGGPMIMGWHRTALRFLKRNRKAFETTPLAVFVMAMSLTKTGEGVMEGLNIFVDTGLAEAPKSEAKLSFRERYATLSNYLRPILKATRPSTPASIGVFGGRMEYGRLKWWEVVFAMVIVQAQAGDRRDWNAIRSWAEKLPAAFRF